MEYLAIVKELLLLPGVLEALGVIVVFILGKKGIEAGWIVALINAVIAAMDRDRDPAPVDHRLNELAERVSSESRKVNAQDVLDVVKVDFEKHRVKVNTGAVIQKVIGGGDFKKALKSLGSKLGIK